MNALERAATSEVFRDLFEQMTIFPLRPMCRLEDDQLACTCALGAECKNLGKHPDGSMLPDGKWRTLTQGQKVLPDGDAGYGIATGTRSGLWTLDVDDSDANERLNELGDTPSTFTIATGRGWHLYFKLPPFIVRCSAGELARGIDVRGEGGFVVGPGSRHKSGVLYEVVEDVPIADAPAWLLQWPGLQSRALNRDAVAAVEAVPIADAASAYGRWRIATSVRYLSTAPLSIEGRGGRNTFFVVACNLVRRQRLPLDVAADCIEQIYNPRLAAAGTTTWTRKEIDERLISARDTSTVPAADIMSEARWFALFGERAA